jgi:hypothetical protein
VRARVLSCHNPAHQAKGLLPCYGFFLANRLARKRAKPSLPLLWPRNGKLAHPWRNFTELNNHVKNLFLAFAKFNINNFNLLKMS